MKVTILIVEDDAVIAHDFQRSLAVRGHAVAGILRTGEDAVAFCETARPDLIIMDIGLAGAMDGITAAERILEKHDVPVLYVSANSDESTFARAMETGPWGFLVKPLQDASITTTIDIILKRLEAELNLKRSEEKFRRFFNDDLTGDFIAAPDGTILDCNPAFLKLYGIPSPDDATGASITRFFADRTEWRGLVERLHENRILENYETASIRENGERIHVVVNLSADIDARGGITEIKGYLYDITRRTTMENELRAALAEREVLLKEIHHRVKNNFQVTSSLINLQAKHIADRDARDKLDHIRNQLHSMALAHTIAYESSRPSSPNAGTLIRQISENHSGAYSRRSIEVSISVADEHHLSLDQAIPCALIINELIENAATHAFIGRETGAIHISLTAEDEDYLLIVEDNGIGMPGPASESFDAGFGMQLVVLIVNQIGGCLRITSPREGGARFEIRFPIAPALTPP